MWINYLRTAVAVLLRRKFFTFASLFGITFTLIVMMVVAAMFEHLVRPGGPERDAARFLDVNFIAIQSPDRRSAIHSGPGYLFLDGNVRRLTTPERITLYTRQTTAVSFETGERVERMLRYTDAEFWNVFHFEFLEGAPFSAADDSSGRSAAVIGRKTRDLFFGEGRSAVGQSFRIAGRPVTVVGVVEEVSILLGRTHADVWMPIGAQPSTEYRKQLSGSFRATLLRGPGTSKAEVKREFRNMLSTVVFPDPKEWNWVMSAPDTALEFNVREAIGTYEEFDTNVVGFLGLVIGALLLFSLLPTINLVNLNLSRILERSSEIGIRKSFGATSRELVGQFLFENVLLTAVGGLLGAIGAKLVLRLLANSGAIPGADFGFSYLTFLAGLAAILLFGLFSGVYPAWRMSRLHPVDALRGRA